MAWIISLALYSILNFGSCLSKHRRVIGCIISAVDDFSLHTNLSCLGVIENGKCVLYIKVKIFGKFVFTIQILDVFSVRKCLTFTLYGDIFVGIYNIGSSFFLRKLDDCYASYSYILLLPNYSPWKGQKIHRWEPRSIR